MKLEQISTRTKTLQLEILGIHRVKVEIRATFSEKSDFFPAFGHKKCIVFQPYHESTNRGEGVLSPRLVYLLRELLL